MKRIIALVFVLVLALSLVACGGKFTCDECGKEKSGSPKKAEFMGETANLCSECYAEFEELMGELNDLEDQLGDLEGLLG